MTQSVYERVLGSEFDSLAPELRAYFSGGHGVGVGRGELNSRRTLHLPVRDRPLEDTMRSDRQWVRILGAKISIPQLANVTVSESWLAGYQHVDVRLATPVIGERFRHAGSFTHSYPGV